jgi:hypothetical protein
MVVCLSDLASVRLTLDYIASTMLGFERDWDDDHNSRFDRLTPRQRLILQQHPPLLNHFRTVLSMLQAVCPHPGLDPVPATYARLQAPAGFNHPVLCVICLASLP